MHSFVLARCADLSVDVSTVISESQLHHVCWWELWSQRHDPRPQQTPRDVGKQLTDVDNASRSYRMIDRYSKQTTSAIINQPQGATSE